MKFHIVGIDNFANLAVLRSTIERDALLVHGIFDGYAGKAKDFSLHGIAAAVLGPRELVYICVNDFLLCALLRPVLNPIDAGFGVGSCLDLDGNVADVGADLLGNSAGKGIIEDFGFLGRASVALTIRLREGEFDVGNLPDLRGGSVLGSVAIVGIGVYV